MKHEDPLTGGKAAVARLLGCSVSTVQRLAKNDPHFPQPVQLGNGWRWVLSEIPAYLANKERRQQAA